MKDIILKEDKSLTIENGDFVVDESSQQHVELILDCHKGNNREFPVAGFGITRYLKGKSDVKRFERELKVELESDGFSNPKISVDDSYNLGIDV